MRTYKILPGGLKRSEIYPDMATTETEVFGNYLQQASFYVECEGLIPRKIVSSRTAIQSTPVTPPRIVSRGIEEKIWHKEF